MPDVATTRILHAPENTNAPTQPTPWIWPLPRLDGELPCLLASPDDPAVDDVPIGYPLRSQSSSFVPVLAAQDGVIAYAVTANGCSSLCVDHPGGWSTQYADLEHLLAAPTDRFHRRRKTRVRAGDVLGHARRSALRIRFGLRQLTDGEWNVVEPAHAMRSWSVLPWFTEPGQRAAGRSAA